MYVHTRTFTFQRYSRCVNRTKEPIDSKRIPIKIWECREPNLISPECSGDITEIAPFLYLCRKWSGCLLCRLLSLNCFASDTVKWNSCHGGLLNEQCHWGHIICALSRDCTGLVHEGSYVLAVPCRESMSLITEPYDIWCAIPGELVPYMCLITKGSLGVLCHG
jgi:hypothetical protein